MANTDTLTSLLDDVGDAIREKTGKTAKMAIAEMPAEIAGISGNKPEFFYLRSFNGITVTDTTVSTYARFKETSSIEAIVKSYTYHSVRDFSGFMASNRAITSFDFAWVDVWTYATYFNFMFMGCSRLEELKNADILAPTVYKCPDMFNGCSALQAIDLATWDFSKLNVSDMNKGNWKMFSGCTSLQTLKLPASWPGPGTYAATFPVAMYDETGTAYASGDVIPAGAHTYTTTDPTA